MNLIIIAGLSNKKLISKIAPIANSDFIEKIFLVRRYPLSYKKVICYSPPKVLRANIITSELYRFAACFYLCLFEKIDAIMGIFLICHGVFAAFTGKIFSKPVVQNVIGTDIYYLLNKPFLFQFLKNAKMIITRGANIKEVLMNRVIESEKIYCIPNVFIFNKVPYIKDKTENKKYDLIFIGNLVKQKRLDILLKTISKLKFEYNFQNIKVALVGDGPLRKSLEKIIDSTFCLVISFI